MIKSININNFKSLKNINIDFGNFNLICGTNASGKSSLLQSILLMSQNVGIENEILLNGELINLGEFLEVKNFDSGVDNPVSIILKNDKEEAKLSFSKDEIFTKAIDFPKINQELFYLAANRIGNADVFDRALRKNTFGFQGEYAISFLEEHQDEVMPSELIFDKNEETAHLFVDEVNYWMKRITGSTLKVEKIQKTNKLVLSYSNNKNYFVRTSNTGSGLSYVVSIIILGLGVALINSGKQTKPSIIIENPEIHLHPKAQSVLTELLAWLSNHMQVIIETHSDHIFNGLRKLIKKQALTTDSSKIFFFKLNNNETEVIPIMVAKSGKLLTIEKDLFDQFQLDLSSLIGV